jgi:hypothetical protein
MDPGFSPILHPSRNAKRIISRRARSACAHTVGASNEQASAPSIATETIADGHLMHLNGELWENFGAQHGLSSNGLFTVFFDKSGNIWSAAKFNVFLLRKSAEHFETFAATTFAVTQFPSS